MPLEEGDQVGRVASACDGNDERRVLAVPGGDDGEHHGEHGRTEDGHEQRGGERAAVPHVIEQLLAQHDRGLSHHLESPASVPMAATNASSRLSRPVLARSSSGVPSATILPLAMTTTRSQSAATSCMTWLEKSTHFP